MTETPTSIRAQYEAPRTGETPEERRRRLANRRAAKYRYFKSLGAPAGEAAAAEQDARREQNSRRQSKRRCELDESARSRTRELNRVRQQLRRRALSDDTRQEIRDQQRERQRMRRTLLDHGAKEELRERERLRVRMRRARLAQTGAAAAAGAARVHSASLPQLPPLTPRARGLPESPRSPPVLPLPLTRAARTAISASGVLNSSTRLEPPPSGFHLPPVFAGAGGGYSSYGFARFEPELPNLQPHLRQLQQQQLLHASLSSFQLASLPPALPVHAAFAERVPPLPHLQLALPQASPLPPPSLLFQLAPSQSPPPPPPAPTPASGLPGLSFATAASYSTSSLGMLSLATSSGSSAGSVLPPSSSAAHVLPPIAIPPPVRALPPLPDFLNSREPFASSYLPIFVDPASGFHDGATTTVAFRSY